MAENKTNSRIGVYIGNELLSRCDTAIPKTNASSRSEFICDALESVIGGKIAGTEDLDNLRDMCIDEVAHIGGRYRLEEAIEFQNG